jgi:hypothetical protein
LLQNINAYPYLWASLLSFAILLVPVLLAMPRKLRGSLFIVGLLNAGTSPFCALLEVTYWSPVRIGGWRLGVEDFIIGFVLGAAAWGAAIWPMRHRIELNGGIIAAIRRLALTLAYLIPFVGLHALGLSWMSSFLMAMAVVFVVQLLLRPSLWPLAICGVLVFVPLYFLYLQLLLVIWPAFYLQWNPATPWGLSFLGAPLGEITWSVLFALALPLLAGYILDIRLAHGPRRRLPKVKS